MTNTKNHNGNVPGAKSLIRLLNSVYTVLIIFSMISLIGETSDHCFEAYTLFDVMKAGVIISLAWLLGWLTGKY